MSFLFKVHQPQLVLYLLALSLGWLLNLRFLLFLSLLAQLS
jgi:hypothetical protein